MRARFSGAKPENLDQEGSPSAPHIYLYCMRARAVKTLLLLAALTPADANYQIGTASPPPPKPPPKPPPPPPSQPPPPVTMATRLPPKATVGVAGGAVKVGAPGTVGGVPQVKAFTSPPPPSGRRLQSSSVQRSEMLGAKCSGNLATGCLTTAAPEYTRLAQQSQYQLVQQNENVLFSALPSTASIQTTDSTYISWSDYDK